VRRQKLLRLSGLPSELVNTSPADEPACQSYARVTIVDAEGASARACPRHALAALNGITGAHVDWPDSKDLKEWERQALELAEERSQPGELARQGPATSTASGPRDPGGLTSHGIRRDLSPLGRLRGRRMR
jgi:hypothetical protein